MATKYERTLERIQAGNGDPGGSQTDIGSVPQPPWWTDLTSEQREIQYNRDRKCKHEYTYSGPDYAPDLRESFSFDPYFHTAHMDPCARYGTPPPSRWSIDCECQMCVGKIGVPEDQMGKVNEERVRAKLSHRRPG